MDSDTGLPHQPDAIQQQPSLMKKKNNFLWLGFFILLIILHLPFGWILAYIVSRVGVNSDFYILWLSPLFFSLMIIDFIAFMSFIKESPPWKFCFILLLIFNILFFYEAIFAIKGPSGMMGLIVIIPLLLFLLIIDLMGILSYHYS